MNELRGSRRYTAAMLLIFAVGAYLRLNSLSTQILVDDEWHNIVPVIGAKFFKLLTQYDAQTNSNLPLVLYDFVLYHTIGWSELAVRLPSILTGLLSLALLPLLISKTFNRRAAVVFASLLAVSPFLIFYSRYARTYGLFMLLAFMALLYFHRWLATGERRQAVGFIITGILAIYFHLLSVVAIFTPPMLALAIKAAERFRLQVPEWARTKVKAGFIFAAVGIIAVAILPLMIPALYASRHLPWQQANLTLDGVTTAATLLTGTPNVFLSVLLAGLFLAGLRPLFRRELMLGWLFMATIAANVVTLLIAKPAGVNTGNVLMRYLIILLPIVWTAAALAVDELCESAAQRRLHWSIPGAATAVFVAALYFTGPLPAESKQPNNFSNHSAYQGSYSPQNWEASRANTFITGASMKEDQIPPFYHWLAGQSNVQTVIEYPFDICDFNDLFYYTQHFHKKRVLVGYCTDPTLRHFLVGLSPPVDESRYEIGRMSCDEIFSRVKDPSKLNFENMVDITEASPDLGKSADLLIMHKYMIAPKIPTDGVNAGPTYLVQVYFYSVIRLQQLYTERYGRPVYEDGQIVCFRLKPAAQATP